MRYTLLTEERPRRATAAVIFIHFFTLDLTIIPTIQRVSLHPVVPVEYFFRKPCVLSFSKYVINRLAIIGMIAWAEFTKSITSHAL